MIQETINLNQLRKTIQGIYPYHINNINKHFYCLIFNQIVTSENILGILILSFLISLFIGQIITSVFKFNSLNNITYFQRLIGVFLFVSVTLLSIFSYKGVQYAKDYKPKYELEILEKNNLKTKLDKVESDLSKERLENITFG